MNREDIIRELKIGTLFQNVFGHIFLVLDITPDRYYDTYCVTAQMYCKCFTINDLERNNIKILAQT